MELIALFNGNIVKQGPVIHRLQLKQHLKIK